VEGAGGAKVVADGARRGVRGRGMVVVRWGWGCLEGWCGGEEGCGLVAVVGVGRAGVGVDEEACFGVWRCDFDSAECDFNVPFARTWSNILLVDGVACCPVADAAASSSATFVAVACASSNIVLFAGADGVVCCAVATVFGASFVGAGLVFAGRAGAVFFGFTALSLATALFAGALLASVFFTSNAIAPASPGVTLLGRPRFLTAGGSVAVVADIGGGQLARRLKYRRGSIVADREKVECFEGSVGRRFSVM